MAIKPAKVKKPLDKEEISTSKLAISKQNPGSATKKFLKSKSAIKGKNRPGASKDDFKVEKLAYICDMLAELRQLSIEIDESMVTYLIEMAILEASTARSIDDFSDELGATAKPA